MRTGLRRRLPRIRAARLPIAGAGGTAIAQEPLQNERRLLGLVGNIIVGIIGGFLGGFLFRQFGASAGSGMTGSLVVSFVGAVVLLLIIGFVKKA
jgi:uncharacterized membrane protein YeaQ/YmgE (transglycosylase-associated protein family)